MIENGEPRVLEFNVRFGDPEATVLVPLYGGSWLELLGAPPVATPRRLPATSRRSRPDRPRRPLRRHGGRGLSRHAPYRRRHPRARPAPTPTERLRAARRDCAPGGRRGRHRGGRVLAVAGARGYARGGSRARYAAAGRIHWRGEHHRARHRPARARPLTRPVPSTEPRRHPIQEPHGRDRPAHSPPLRLGTTPSVLGSRGRSAVRRHQPASSAPSSARARPAQRRAPHPARGGGGREVRERRGDPRRAGVASGVLVRDAEPAFYRYDQTFAPPGSSRRQARSRRRGFLALVRLVPLSAAHRPARTSARSRAPRRTASSCSARRART